MATADISKESVFDARIVQHAPAYAVNKGALSLTAVPFNAISQTSTQHTYNINVPSQNVFIDRAVDWSSTCNLAVAVAPITVATLYPYTGATPGTVSLQPVLTFGQDCALTNFPLHSCVGTMTATINDTTTTMNTGDILKQVLRLASWWDDRLPRTCPTYEDTYQSYNQAYACVNNPLAGYADAVDSCNVPNGAYPNVVFTNAQGAPLVGGTTTTPGSYLTTGGATIYYINGVPVRDSINDPNGYQLYVSFSSTEKLVLSPFIFADSAQWETGLFGINAIQIVCNLQSPSRVLRSTTQNGRFITSVAYNQPSNGNSPFSNSQILFQFLTPSLDIPLPPKSVVEYMEYPRYLSNFTVAGTQPGQSETLQSQTIVLPPRFQICF